MDAALKRLPPTVWLGAAFFLLAFVVRLAGIGWGLPNDKHHWSYHPDEPVVWAYSQQIQPGSGKFTPGFYNYGTSYLMVLRVTTDMVNSYGGGPKQQDGSDQHLAMARYHLAGRVVSALAGAGLAWLVLLVLWGRTHIIGVFFGALAVVFAPGLVVHSRFQTVDMYALFWLVLGLYWTLRWLERPENPEKFESHLHWLVGAAIGVSAGTKYAGILAIAPFVWFAVRGKKWRDLGIGLGACLLFFVLATPGSVLETAKFLKDFTYEMSHTSEGHGLVFAGTAPGFVHHWLNLFIGLGAGLCLMGLAGLGRAAFKKHPWAFALVLFAGLHFLLIGRAEVKFLRYTLPLIPVLCCGAGWLVGQAHSHPDRRWKLVGVLGVLALGGIGGGGLGFTVRSINDMAGTDPRASVPEALKAAGARNVAVVSDPWFYTPDFYPEAGAPRWVPYADRYTAMAQAGVLRYVPEDNPESRQDWDERVLDLNPDAVVFSSFESEGLDRLVRLGRVPSQFQSQVDRFRSFATRLQRDYEPVPLPESLGNPWAQVHDLMYIRPVYWLWKRKTGS